MSVRQRVLDGVASGLSPAQVAQQAGVDPGLVAAVIEDGARSGLLEMLAFRGCSGCAIGQVTVEPETGAASPGCGGCPAMASRPR